MMEIHLFPTKLTSIISKIINTWNIRLVIPNILSEPVGINIGVNPKYISQLNAKKSKTSESGAKNQICDL